MICSTSTPLARRVRALAALLLGASGALGTQASLAAESEAAAQPGASSTSNAASAPQRYTTRAGDTLERIAQQQFRDSPLQPAIVVKALQEHNALLIGEVRARQRLKTGLLLELPSHEQLARKVLMPYLQAESAPRPVNSEPEQRKAWVRYP